MFTQAIKDLQAKKTVQVRPRGNSMTGRINSGQLVTIRPCEPSKVSKGQVVLVRVGRNMYLHLVVDTKPDSVLIGNNHGKINGWVFREKVYGIVEKVE